MRCSGREQAAQMWNRAKCGSGGAAMPNAEGARNGISRRERGSSHGAENEPCCRQGSGYVSNVIYQKVHVIRLIIVSGFLSNYIPVIYQIAR